MYPQSFTQTSSDGRSHTCFAMTTLILSTVICDTHELCSVFNVILQNVSTKDHTFFVVYKILFQPNLHDFIDEYPRNVMFMMLWLRKCPLFLQTPQPFFSFWDVKFTPVWINKLNSVHLPNLGFSIALKYWIIFQAILDRFWKSV